MKTNKKHFEIFKKECEYWIDRFELSNWEIFFEFKKEKDIEARALCSTDEVGRIVNIDFSDEFLGFDKITNEDIKQTAKHEIIHLLLADIANQKHNVFSSEREWRKDLEIVVRKLENIIK